MPDNQMPGMLEDFLAFLIPAGDPLLPRVDDFLEGIPRPRLFNDAHLPKARIHCWLALQKVPGRPFGVAMMEKWLDAESHTADPFVRWLREALVD